MTLPRTAILAAICLSLLAACGKPGERVEITETKVRSDERPVDRVNATSEERFALAMPRTAPPMAAPGMAPVAIPFDYTVPEGWTEIAPTQFRNPNFVAGEAGEIECYVSTLPGGGGGLLVNANRWRGQMGREPFTDAEFAELPRAMLLGGEGVIVDFGGTFSGMGQAQANEGFRLIGALIELPVTGVFIKMVGPDEAVQAQKNTFAGFAQSLAMKAAQTPDQSASLPDGHVDVAADTSAPAATESDQPFSWTAPAGWREATTSSPMRLVTYVFGPDDIGECYVVVLGGDGGGRLNNMNRWLSQVGQAPLDEAELELQPKIPFFGELVPMLIASGTYTGMGGEVRPDHIILGATVEINGQSLFVKLIAPQGLANQHWNNFEEFCGSFSVD